MLLTESSILCACSSFKLLAACALMLLAHACCLSSRVKVGHTKTIAIFTDDLSRRPFFELERAASFVGLKPDRQRILAALASENLGLDGGFPPDLGDRNEGNSWDGQSSGLLPESLDEVGCLPSYILPPRSVDSNESFRNRIGADCTLRALLWLSLGSRFCLVHSKGSSSAVTGSRSGRVAPCVT